MPDYRIFFLDNNLAVLGRDDFKTDCEQSARIIAEQIFSACADHYENAELWSGKTRLASLSPIPRVREVTPAMQRVIAERAKALLESDWSVARSARLQATYQAILTQLDLDGP